MKKILLLTLTMLTLGACVDNEIDGSLGISRSTTDQPVIVVPEFKLVGVEHIPLTLRVTEMGLTVSELRFAPVNTDGIAYTTVDPILVKFDLSEGEVTKMGSDRILLPKAGRYLVSMRLEPRPDKNIPQSFSMSGSVDEVIAADEESDGWPQPVFDKEFQMGWTPFHYESRRTVFFSFNDIYISNGTQSLAFEFDASKWSSVAASISKAVRNTEIANKDGVDVTRTVESSGDDYEALIETGVVQNNRPR